MKQLCEHAAEENVDLPGFSNELKILQPICPKSWAVAFDTVGLTPSYLLRGLRAKLLKATDNQPNRLANTRSLAFHDLDFGVRGVVRKTLQHLADRPLLVGCDGENGEVLADACGFFAELGDR